MDLNKLIEAVDNLPPEDLNALEAHIAQRKQAQPSHHRTVEEWMGELKRIADDFRGDSTEEEMAEIVAAMTTKSTPSEKGL